MDQDNDFNPHQRRSHSKSEHINLRGLKNL